MNDDLDDALLIRLKQEIAENGPMTVSDYMARCLYDPEHGYYRRRSAIGSSGDFITAPEISQIFGELLGIWVAAVWQQMGSPRSLHLVELGPGRGTMMRDVLRALRVVPHLLDGLHVTLVDVSESLRDIQRDMLRDVEVPVKWLPDLSTLTDCEPSTPIIVLANEFFDALPVTQLVQMADDWVERTITLTPSGDLAFAQTSDGSDVIIRETRRPALCNGEPSIQSILKTLSQSRPFALLAIDYGCDDPGLGDTLQAVHGHQYADVLSSPGHQDLTAHVDFAELGDIFRDVGLNCDGPLSQSAFLGGLAFSARLERLLAGKAASDANAIETAAHRLVAEPGMGNRFHVLAARSANLPALAPFVSPVETRRR